MLEISGIGIYIYILYEPRPTPSDAHFLGFLSTNYRGIFAYSGIATNSVITLCTIATNSHRLAAAWLTSRADICTP